MKKEILKRIFEFLEDKEEHKAPFIWKLENNIPLTEEELNVKGNLNLAHSEISFLPEGLKVRGNLSLYSCKNIKSLPEGLDVGGDLYIYGTELKKYSEEELRDMIKPGFIKGKVIR